MTTTTLDPLSLDIQDGLWSSPPSLPPRWFYDEKGSRLFDAITRTEEYYPTRSEIEILQRVAHEIVGKTQAHTVLELGAGMATKTRILLDAFTQDLTQMRYVPLDVSEEVLLESAQALRSDYPTLEVEPHIADFHHLLPTPPGEAGGRLMIFLGGTIGNFTEDERQVFLERFRRSVEPGDYVLLGADLIKDRARLQAAYDDAQGITAAFNLNVIDVINHHSQAEGLRREDFVHEARWNAAERRIEMWLRARTDITAHFPLLDRTWQLPRGEGVLTEISRKFDAQDFRAELQQHRLESVRWWTDDNGYYSLTLAQAQA